MAKKYVTTKLQCQKKIDTFNTVCDYCGGNIVPIETVDNADNPTYWPGCYHGDDSGHFTSGCPHVVLELAETLILNGEQPYSHLSKLEYKSTQWHRKYWFQSQVSGMCALIQKIERAKTLLPKQTKEEFLSEKNW